MLKDASSSGVQDEFFFFFYVRDVNKPGRREDCGRTSGSRCGRAGRWRTRCRRTRGRNINWEWTRWMKMTKRNDDWEWKRLKKRSRGQLKQGMKEMEEEDKERNKARDRRNGRRRRGIDTSTELGRDG